MLRVVIINGYPQAGKDTFVDFCREYITVVNIWTSSPAKKALKYLGWDEKEKTPEVREALYNLKQISVKLFDGSVKYVVDQFNRNVRVDGLMFVHSREPEEIRRLQYIFKAPAILIKRELQEVPSNPSDAEVEDYDYDLVIDNNGTLLELRDKAREFVERMMKK